MAVVGFAVLLFSGWNGLSMSCRQKLLSEGAKRRRDCSKSVEFSQSKWSPLSSQACQHASLRTLFSIRAIPAESRHRPDLGTEGPLGGCWVGDCGVDHRDPARGARAGSPISAAYRKTRGKLGGGGDGPKGLLPAV
jgi:hypothetical protein